MAEVLSTQPANEGNVVDDAKHRQRRRKSGNSDLFNELLSQANQLSVAERTRLVKSLAGQLGLLAVGGQTLLDKPASAGEPKKGKQAGASAPEVRPNPLKGTKFWTEKETAKQSMLKAREDGGGAQLPDDHPAVTAYAAALKNYKDQQTALKPVTSKSQAQAPSKKVVGAKRAAERSPERGSSVVTRAKSAVKRLTGSKSASFEMETE